jgi:acetyl esterase/lipase
VPANETADADLAGLADAGLARWVAEIRQASGPSWRESGAAALREDSRRRAAARPPAVIATAEHDPLRDEGGTLARSMRAAGVKVLFVPHPGLVHGFLGLAHISAAAERAGEELFGRFGRLLREDLPAASS